MPLPFAPSGRRSASFLRPEALESLEPRVFLSITAAMDSTTITPTDWLLVVHYRSDTTIDTSSLANAIRVTSPATGGAHPQAAYSVLARLWEAPRVQQDGSVIQVYAAQARGGAWDYADTGHYRVTTVAGTARDNGGATIGATTLADNFLWFTTPRADVTLAVVGGSGWQIQITYSDDVGIDATTIGNGNIEVHGPNGLLAIATSNFVSPQPDGTVKAYYTAKIAQVSASWLNSGVYDFFMRPAQVIDTAGHSIPGYDMGPFSYSSGNPGVQLVLSQMRSTDWLVKVRYSDDTGILRSSIGALPGDVRAIGSGVTQLGVLQAGLVTSADGSIMATYSIPAPAGGWNRTDGAYHLDYFGTGHVRDIDGHFITGGSFILAPDFSPTAPTASVASSTRVSASTWDVTVNFNDETGLIQDSFLTGTPLEVDTLYGYRALLTVQSSTMHSAGSWTVTFRLTTTAKSFTPGSYYLRTTQFGVEDSDGHWMPSSELLAFTL